MIYRAVRMGNGVLFYRLVDDLAWTLFVPASTGLITQEMAASLLGKSVMTINRWVRTGRLASVKMKGKSYTLVPLKDALAAIPIKPK